MRVELGGMTKIACEVTTECVINDKLPWETQIGYLSLSLVGEELADLFLLVDVILFQQLLVKPVGVAHPGHRVLHLLQGRWDGDDLLDGTAQTLNVVAPVKDLFGGGGLEIRD